MKPVQYDLEIYKGSSFSRAFTFKNKKTHQVIDLTGYTPKAQIRPAENSEVLSKEFTMSVSGGTVTMQLSASDTAELQPGIQAWDFKLTDEGNVKYWIRGKVLITGRVTV